MADDLRTLRSRLSHCLLADRQNLFRRLKQLEQRQQQGKPFDKGASELAAAIDASAIKVPKKTLKNTRKIWLKNVNVIISRS